MSGKGNIYRTNGPNKDADQPEEHPNKDEESDERLDDAEDSPAEESASESEADSDVEIEPAESISKLKLTIKRLRTSNANRKLEHVIARTKRDELQAKKEAQLRKEIQDWKLKLELSKSNLRGQKKDHQARVAAVELKSRVKLQSVVKQTKDELRVMSTSLRDSRKADAASRVEVTKMMNKTMAVEKKYQSLTEDFERVVGELKEVKLQQKKDVKELEKTKKKVEEQLAMKLAVQRDTARFALERERIGLKRDKAKKREKAQLIELEHNKRVKFHDHKVHSQLTVAETKSKVKLKEQKQKLKESIDRLEVSNGLHNSSSGQFPNAGGSGTFASIQEVSLFLLFIYFILICLDYLC